MSVDVDVLVVGAGLSGIGAACHLEERLPGTSYAVLEARETSGGTWDLFRYPGVRTDSDMYTLGYRFRPWTHAQSIADGASILRYVRETAEAYGVDRHIRYQQRVVSASWSSDDARWTVTTASGDVFTCGFLWCCSGYYRYDAGYSPDFEAASAPSTGGSCTRSTGRTTSTCAASAWWWSAAVPPPSPSSPPWPMPART